MPTHVRQQNLKPKNNIKPADKHHKTSTIPTNNSLAKTTDIQTKITSKKTYLRLKTAQKKSCKIAYKYLKQVE